MLIFHPFNSEGGETVHEHSCMPLHKQIHLLTDLYLSLIPHITHIHLQSMDNSDLLHVQNISHI